ncbi:MAG: hypothetical protein WCK17_18850, partial [Verrucomicrobiota bacterium]
VNNRWASTRGTSAAIEALAELSTRLTFGDPAKSYRIEVGGRNVFTVNKGEALKKMFHEIKLTAEQLGGENRNIKLTADCPEKVYFTLTASGHEQMNSMEPIGTDVCINRSYNKTDGAPLNKQAMPGELIAVKIRVTLKQPQNYVIVQEPIPAGWEFAGDKLVGTASILASNVEFRDDRLCAFFTQLPAGEHELIYYLRAETPGTVSVLPACAYPMYSEKLRGETGSNTLQVQAIP